jgi:hypothetical protein
MWQLIAGPLFGLIGSGVEKWAEHKENQRKDAERREERKHELDVMQFELDNAVTLEKLRGNEKRMTIDQQVFGDNIKAAAVSLIPEGQKLEGWMLGLTVCTEVFCKAVRPTSTVFYQIFVAAIFTWAAYNAVQQGAEVFAPEEYAQIVKEVIYSVIGMAETTLFWWYGIRRMSKKK